MGGVGCEMAIPNLKTLSVVVMMYRGFHKTYYKAKKPYNAIPGPYISPM